MESFEADFLWLIIQDFEVRSNKSIISICCVIVFRVYLLNIIDKELYLHYFPFGPSSNPQKFILNVVSKSHGIRLWREEENNLHFDILFAKSYVILYHKLHHFDMLCLLFHEQLECSLSSGMLWSSWGAKTDEILKFEEEVRCFKATRDERVVGVDIKGPLRFSKQSLNTFEWTMEDLIEVSG